MKKENTSLNDFCKYIKKLTHYNNHTEARIVIAKYYSLKNYIKIFNAIKTIHETEGFLPYDLSNYRYYKTNEMLQYIKTNVSEIDFDELNSCL